MDMIVSNYNVEDVILFEDCIQQSIDDSVIHMEMLDKQKYKKYTKRKLSTPILGSVVNASYNYNTAHRSQNEIPKLTERTCVGDVMMSEEIKSRHKKRFARTQSLPSFCANKDEDDFKYCQGMVCKELATSQRQYATKICHHSICQEQNNMNPVMLCSSCDSQNHCGNLASHLRFDLQTNLVRKGSVRSINSDSGTEEDTDPVYRFDKKNRTYSSARRFFNIAATKNRTKLKKINSFELAIKFEQSNFLTGAVFISEQRYRDDVNLLIGLKSVQGFPIVLVMRAVVGGQHERLMRHNYTRSESLNSLVRVQSFKGQNDSSKELFTLQFCDNGKNVWDTEKVPVRKGKSLKESIETLLTNRGLDFDTHSVFLDSSKTPLPLAFDTFPLGGNILHVKANEAMKVDERIMELMKNAEEDKKQQGQRQKKNIMSIFNDDNDQTGVGKVSSLPNNASKLGRRSGMFSSAKDISSRSLTDVLSHYRLNGFDLDINIGEGVPEPMTDIILEDSWTDVIIGKEEMSRQETIQQEAIWELLITERNYLKKVRVIIQVFQKCLINLQRENFLTEVENNKLFSNITDVYEANLTFWTKYLKQVVEEARSTKEPIRPSQLLDSFAQFEDLFEPYIKYCMEETSCVKYLKQLKRTDDTFEEYLTWCENHEQCMRLKLADLLVKPMQRVTKYGLLLKTVLSKTTDEEERLSVTNMINQVELFVTKINTTLRLRHEKQKLDDVLKRIEVYNPVEAASEEIERIISDYCNLDLRGKIPGLAEEEQRCILLEGPMKMIEKHGRSEVHAFLFTDVLILTKMKKGSDKLRIIRQPFRLSKVLIHALRDVGSFVLIYLNEYDVLVTAFTLEVKANEHFKWIQAIEKSKNRYMKARAGNGSTLDFFDDEASMMLSPSTGGYLPDVSPSRDRRSSTFTGDDTPNLSASTQERQPAIVVTDDVQLRSRSTAAISDLSRRKADAISNEANVKRSLSDPKSGPRNRDKKIRPRPMSLVSDRDTASWVLTNEKRNRSGSIPSDISEDRSSGIGDSFRSINSDGAVQLSRDSGISIKASNSYPEVSQSVSKLKTRFESESYSPTREEGSNSSISTTSLTMGCSESLSTSQSGTTRRTSPPDFMEHHSTIQEEEEHSSNNSYERVTELIYRNDSSESLRTSNDGSSTIQPSTEDSPYENLDYIKKSINHVRMSACLSDEVYFASSETKQCVDAGIQCDGLDVSALEIVDSNNLTPGDGHTGQDLGNDIIKIDIREKESIDASTQCDKDIAVQVGCNDIATQYDTSCVLSDVGTQCGDFIHLSGTCESDTEDGDAQRENVPFSAPPAYVYTPMLDMLTGKKNSKQPRGILKHSCSELNLATMEDYPKDLVVFHARSRSDEPQVTMTRYRNSAPAYESPGMKALQTLSESLESSLKNNQPHLISRPTTKQCDEDTSSNSHNPGHSHGNNNVKTTSPSLHKVALINSSPVLSRDECSASDYGQLTMTRASSDVNHSVVPLRDRSSDKKTTESKRNTWHDFDSVALLEHIEQAKYGPEGRTEPVRLLAMNSSAAGMSKSFSKSTEMLNTPRKQHSFKKSLLKKLSTANLFDRPEDESPPHEEVVDMKKLKKQLKKEEKKMKKELRLKEKEEKKRDKTLKRRTSSLSSSGSSSVSSKQPCVDGKMVSIVETAKPS